MTSSLRIIVTGLVGLYPVGGVAWDYLQYVVGLAQLGHDVFYHEDTWSWPYHPRANQHTSDGSYSAQFINDFFVQYAPELRTRWHYRHLHETSFGMEQAAFDAIAQTADLFLNVSGACILPDTLSSRCERVFLDTDPGYNQILLSERLPWSENIERWCASSAEHTQFVTYAENIDGPDCLIPTLGYDWKPTRMPIVLSLWERLALRQPPALAPWTTIMTWNAFKGSLIYKGVEYTSKGTEFEKLLATLPCRTQVPLKMAIGGVQAPLQRLQRAGWEVVDAPSVSLTPAQYQAFIAESAGELSPAKHVYVAMRSGWFSCRSACYLAAGRPVITQDTGFGRILPTGRGLFAFQTVEQVVEALDRIQADRDAHARAAREIAGEYFAAERVLTDLLASLGL